MITVGNGAETIRPERFPDGAMRLNLSGKYCEQTDILWAYDNDEEMVVLFYLVSHLRMNTPDVKLTLTMPFLPNARMDRVHDKQHEVFTLKHFASFINSLNFYRVTVWDVHSDVGAALIDRLEMEIPTSVVGWAIEEIEEQHPNDELLLFYPDEGAMKRYSKLYNRPYAFGVKNREWQTGKILDLNVMNGEMVQGKNILIIDDICSKGTTFYYAATRLKELGAKHIYLYVTHCENTVFNGMLIDSGLIQTIYTTDSILTAEHPKIKILRRFR